MVGDSQTTTVTTIKTHAVTRSHALVQRRRGGRDSFGYVPRVRNRGVFGLRQWATSETLSEHLQIPGRHLAETWWSLPDPWQLPGKTLTKPW